MTCSRTAESSTCGATNTLLPVEFSGHSGASRFGHRPVRPSYRANFAGGGTPFDAMIFAPPLGQRSRP